MNTLTLITATIALVGAQNTPQDIPKKELPKAAVCVVCSTGGEGHGEEKAAAGVRYKGKAYYFCNAKEVAEFRKDPDAFVPAVLPRAASSLKATTLGGQSVSLEDYKGKVVLLDFWATWCAPCVKEMPALDKLYKKHAARGLTVLGVSIDEDPKKAVAFRSGSSATRSCSTARISRAGRRGA